MNSDARTHGRSMRRASKWRDWMSMFLHYLRGFWSPWSELSGDGATLPHQMAPDKVFCAVSVRFCLFAPPTAAVAKYTEPGIMQCARACRRPCVFCSAVTGVHVCPPQKTVYGASVIIFEGIMAFADKKLLQVSEGLSSVKAPWMLDMNASHWSSAVWSLEGRNQFLSNADCCILSDVTATCISFAVRINCGHHFESMSWVREAKKHSLLDGFTANIYRLDVYVSFHRLHF